MGRKSSKITRPKNAQSRCWRGFITQLYGVPFLRQDDPWSWWFFRNHSSRISMSITRRSISETFAWKITTIWEIWGWIRRCSGGENPNVAGILWDLFEVNLGQSDVWIFWTIVDSGMFDIYWMIFGEWIYLIYLFFIVVSDWCSVSMFGWLVVWNISYFPIYWE